MLLHLNHLDAPLQDLVSVLLGAEDLLNCQIVGLLVHLGVVAVHQLGDDPLTPGIVDDELPLDITDVSLYCPGLPVWTDLVNCVEVVAPMRDRVEGIDDVASHPLDHRPLVEEVG